MSANQEGQSSPNHDFDIDGQDAPLSSDHEQELDNVAQAVGLDRTLSARIRWINFVLGAAVLLPWNGEGYWPYSRCLSLTCF